MAFTMMVVDDSATMRKIIMKVVRQSQLPVDPEIIEAGNGTEALTLFDSNPVDVILCDINMPEMGGVEFLRQMRSHSQSQEIRVFMVTTESSERIVNEVMKNGANGFITKPFSAQKLFTELREYLK